MKFSIMFLGELSFKAFAISLPTTSNKSVGCEMYSHEEKLSGKKNTNKIQPHTAKVNHSD